MYVFHFRNIFFFLLFRNLLELLEKRRCENNTLVSNHFHSIKSLFLIFVDFDEMLVRLLPVSMYTNKTMADKTPIDMWRFNVPQLKEFLKCRGRTCSLARKAELLRLCESALELQLEVIANDDYVDMVSSRRIVIDSDTNNNSQMIMRSVRDVEKWEDDLSKLPDIGTVTFWYIS